MKKPRFSPRARRLLAAVLWFAAALPFAAPATSPWDAWRLGYTNFELGQQLRDRGDYTRAREAFVKAREHYDTVRKARPDWNQKVIRERLADCNKSITELDRLLGNNAPAAKPKPAVVSESEKRQSELTLLRTRLAEATVEITELKRAADRRRNYESEIAHLLRDQRIAAEKYALLERRFHELRQESAKPDRRAAELQERLVAERMKNDLAEKKLQTAEASLRRNEQEMLKLRHEIRRLEERQRLDRENSERTRSETESLRSALAEANSARTAARARIAELEKQLAERPAATAPLPSPAATASADRQAELAEMRAQLGSAERRSREFQQQCLRLRRENETLMKRAQESEEARLRFEKERTTLSSELAERTAALELTAGELKNLRLIHAKTEAEFKVLNDRKRDLEARLAKRESDDFRALTNANEARKQLGDRIAALQNANTEERARAEVAEKRVTELNGRLTAAEAAKRKLDAELLALRQQHDAAAAEAAKYRELAPQYAALRRNFTALQQENHENKLAAEAAKPREAELNRIKLRLAELDQLKQSLAREQRLNEELNNARRRQEKELQQLRRVENELAAARRRLAAFTAMEKELETLRQLNRQLTKERAETAKVEEVRKKLIDAEAAQLELFELKKQYAAIVKEAETLRARAAALDAEAAAAAQLRSELAARKTEDARLREALRKSDADIAASSEAKRDVENRNRKLISDVAALQRKNTALEEKNATLEKEKAAALTENTALGKEKAAALTENAALRKEIFAVQAENTALRNRPLPKPEVIVKEIRVPVGAPTAKSDDGSAAETQRKLAAAEAENARIGAELATARRTAEEAKRQTAESAAELATARRAAEEAKRQTAESAAELATARRTVEEAKRQADESAAVVGKLRNEVDALRRRGESESAALREAQQQVAESAAAAGKLRDEADALRRRGESENAAAEAEKNALRADLGKLRTENSRLRTEVALGKSRIGELEAQLPQMEKLRKFNDQLMYARSFEQQLAEARLQLARLSRVQDELARTAKLNSELIEAKKQLEAELARRPRFGNPDLTPSLSIVSANLREKPADYIAAARLALADDSPELAVWNYRKALELDASEPEALAELGMLCLRREEYPDAVRLLTAARATRPGDLKLALAAARANLAVKRAGNARAILEPLLKEHAKLAELQLLLGLALAGGGDNAGAEARLRMAMRCDPRNAEIPLELARLLHHTDATRRNDALSLYEHYRMLGGEADLELEPFFGAQLDNRREVESFLTSAAGEAASGGDYQATAWYCRRLIELNRSPERFVPMLAFAQMKQGSPAAARETLTFHKTTPLGLLVRALIDHLEKDAPAAVLSCRQARALNGNRPVAVPPQWSTLLAELSSVSGENSDTGRELKASFAVGR